MGLSFSQRFGYKQVKQIFQIDSIDLDTKNGLWNILSKHFWDRLHVMHPLSKNTFLNRLINILWADYFKIPTDTITYTWKNNLDFIRAYFFHPSRPWYEIYDFLEFISNTSIFNLDQFRKDCNKILEREMSAYRFVGNHIVPIIEEVEIQEIETAINEISKTQFASKHLSNALDLLSDRQNPDYRNSIKESISSIESIAKMISGDSKGELKSALKTLENKLGIEMHGALREGFLKIYGYTSDGDGIRHGLTEEANVLFEDAKFMLVACSAFVNYLVAKADKAAIKLN